MLFDEFVGNQLLNSMGKGMYPSVNKNDLEQLSIPVPSIEVQNKIVKQLEMEQSLIEPSKKVIELFAQKIDNVICEIWGE